MSKPSFIMYKEWREFLGLLSPEDLAALFLAVFNYQCDGAVCDDLSNMAKIAFTIMKNQFDRDTAKYEEKQQKMSDNGKMGGRPKKAIGFSENQTKAKKAVNENVNDNENENVNGDVDAEGGAPLTPEERAVLISEGIPSQFIEERQYRAAEYATKYGRCLTNVLREWWAKDRPTYVEPSPGSFETNDFFEAALSKSMREMEGSK